MEKLTSKFLMEMFRVYFQALKDDRRGALAEFCRNYKVKKWTISRILAGDPSYVPEMEVILSIMRGIKDNPQKHLTIVPNGGNLAGEKATSKGGSKLMEEELARMFQLGEILAHKDLLDKTLLKTLMDLIAAIHSQLTAIIGNSPEIVLKPLNS